MAAVAGGMLASAVLKVVFKQIGAVIAGQIKLQQDFTKDLKKMKMTLETLTAVLKDAERKSIENSSVQVQLWLKRFKNAMYDISDMLDEFEVDTQLPAASLKKCFKKVILQVPYLGPQSKLANEMRKMREELRDITDQQKLFRLEVGSASNEQKIDDTRETAVFMNDNEPVVGRSQDQMKIMGLLSKNIREKLIIFPIYGIGGIGKTTMATSLFNDAVFNEYSRVWVYVSQIFSLKKIGNSIISQILKTESKITEMQMIHTHLAEVLAGKKILIVLDDIWEDNYQSLDKLKKMLNVSEASKIMVILTTRNEGIAKNLHTVQPYKLPPLSNDSCWTIIQQNSKFESRDDRTQLEQIGEDIAKKCGGVALAAKALGNLLRDFTSDEWESVRNSNVWNVSTSEEAHPVLSSLMLTYSYMPSHLRLCFAYCAIFPQGQKMIIDDLIQQWISLDFIDTTHGLSTSRQLGEKYIKQLLGFSFFEHSDTGVHHEDVKHLTMHDLVHDLARWVLSDELIVGLNKLGNNVGSSCRYALFDDCSKKLESYTDSPTKIKALRFLDCGNIGLRGDAFSSAKYIRILDLSNCHIQELPDSVGQLKQLRYLNAPNIQHWMIPNCITKLSKLFHLSFSGSAALLALPDSIGKMEDLIYLNLSWCSGLEKLPESFAKLRKLVHLDLSHCNKVTGGVSESLQSLTNLEFLDISYCWNIRELPEHLGSLLELKYLNMSGCDEIKELPGSFGNLKKLVHLDLSHCQIKVTRDIFGGLTKLHHLNLSHCGCIGGTKVAEAMSNLTKLQYLNLSGFMDTMCHGESAMSTSLEYISTLSNLEHLDLSCNVGLSCLPESIGNLGKLHTLDLSDCSSLCSLPEAIVQMHSLKLTYVKNCGLHCALSHHEFKVHGHAIKGSINGALLRAFNVTKLKVQGLEEMKSIEGMRSIKLIGELGITQLRLVWSRYHERVVEDHEVLRVLEPASTVQRLDIESYNSVLFPAWLMGIPAYNFPNLKSISLVDLANCISLPPFGQLPNLEELVLRKMQSVAKIDEDFCGGDIAFLQLKTFTLDDMESLEVWNTTYSSGGYIFPSLYNLRIYDCPKLRLKPCPPKADQWIIRGSDGVISSWEESMSDTSASTSSPSPVTHLTIKGCKLPLHQWSLLHHLPGLHVLFIQDEQNIRGPPYFGGKRIEIVHHNYIMNIGLMGSPAYNFLDLVRISLEDLDNCISLPPLGQLPNLKSLYLRGMQSIEKIEEDFCGGAGAFPGLESFTLFGMANLKVWNTIYSCRVYMFPSLRQLLIYDCPKLSLKPCPPKAEEWTIQKSDGVISMWGESTSDTVASTYSSPLVTKLTIQGCMLPMHQWRLLHHLPALPELHIKDCSDLTSSPEINRALLLDGLGHLTSLKKLYILQCKNIQSLPESIQKLTKLEMLKISGCPSLQLWCETEENQVKLAHIKEKIVLFKQELSHHYHRNLYHRNTGTKTDSGSGHVTREPANH